MLVRKILRLVCPLLSVSCLGIGFAPTGPWIAGMVVVFILLSWLSAGKWSSGFMPACALVFTVILAVAGALTGAVSLWMLLGVIFALAGWDVVLWTSALAGNSLSPWLTLIDQKHYLGLAAALGLALLATLAGRLVRFQIPFGWMVVLVILTLFSLERIRHALFA